MDDLLTAASAALARQLQAEPLTWLSSSRTLGKNGGKTNPKWGEHCFRAADLQAVGEIVELLRRLVFPGYFDADPAAVGDAGGLEANTRVLISRLTALLTREIEGVQRYELSRTGSTESRGAQPLGAGGGSFAAEVTRAFLERLPEVARLLALDVQAAYDGDPAAEHTDEVILCYPGIDAIFAHRVAHELYQLGVPLLPRAISEQAHGRTGIDIHPGASIGESFFIDHGTGVVIGETSTIGRHVKVYQGVTLGARSFPKDERGRVIRNIKRHPTIRDRVTIYAGAVILGGDTVIGDDCVIAGGVFVTQSVEPGHVVQQPRAEPTLRVNKEAKREKEEEPWWDPGAGI